MLICLYNREESRIFATHYLRKVAHLLCLKRRSTPDGYSYARFCYLLTYSGAKINKIFKTQYNSL